jgi:hypothetical protein
VNCNNIFLLYSTICLSEHIEKRKLFPRNKNAMQNWKIKYNMKIVTERTKKKEKILRPILVQLNQNKKINFILCMCMCSLILVYRVNGINCLSFPKWNARQKPRLFSILFFSCFQKYLLSQKKILSQINNN